ncbi:MAG: hypothetical protein LBB91_09070 [Clostridiales bacterium]|jgi:hypothetical protein|nr:hypothetical protein [Clostridiales bacterium]
MIIAAYAGTGKTTLARMYPEKYMDFVLIPNKFIGHWDNFMTMFEQNRFGHHLILRPDEYLCDAISRIELSG